MTRRTIEIAAFFAVLLLAAFASHAWLASRDDQQRLQVTLSAQQKIIASADANERAHSASLADALVQIEKLRHESQTPQQIAAALQNYLSLPRPLTLVEPTLPQPVAAPTGKSARTRKGTAATGVSHPSGSSSDVSGSNAPGTSDAQQQIAAGQAALSPVPFVGGCQATCRFQAPTLNPSITTFKTAVSARSA